MSGTIEVTADVKMSAPTTYVLLVMDGTRSAATNALPARFRVDTQRLKDGPHVVSAEAYTNHGLFAASKAITISVNNRSAARPAAKPRAPRAAATVTVSTAPRTAKTGPGARTPGSGEPIATARGPLPEPVHPALSGTVAARDREAVATKEVVPLRHTPMIVLNGKPLDAGVAPAITGGHMQSSFRALFAATGARIDWLAGQRTARCTLDSLVVEVPIGSRIATVNGRHVDMGAPAVIRNGRTVVPLQFFAQVTGSRVAWDAQTRVASVRTPSRTLASAQASPTPAASTPAPAHDRPGVRTPAREVADQAP